MRQHQHMVQLRASFVFAPPAFLVKLRPFDRWVISLWRRWAKLFKHRFSIEKRQGALFLLDRTNSVDRNMLTRGSWEPRQIATFTRLIAEKKKPGQPSLFLDIGSHGGLYSILLAQRTMLDRIVAFEPDPVNVVQLRANLFLNGLLDRIEVIQAAATDKAGTIPFYIAADNNRGGSRIGEKGEAPLSRQVMVQAIRVDEVIEAQDAFIAAKIDVESYELIVLSGMGSLLTRNACLLQIETFTEQSEALIAWLVAQGFRKIDAVDYDYYFWNGD